MIDYKVVDFNGIRIHIQDYNVLDCGSDFLKMKEEFLQWNTHNDQIENRMGKDRKFKRMWFSGPERRLADYSRSEVIFSYLCDDLKEYMGAKILQVEEVRTGKHATKLIEHVLNNYSLMSGTPLQGYQKFCDIKFKSSESKKARRTINLQTGAIHPEIPWREMWNIYVSEYRQSF